MPPPAPSILQYHPRADAGDGGITNSVRRLSAGFSAVGARAIIVSDATTPAPTRSSVEWRQINHRSLGPVLLPPALDQSFSDADAVILNSAWTAHNVVAGRAARRLGVPYTLAPRGAYDPLIVRRRRMLKRVWWQFLESALVEHAAAIHVFFDSQAAHLRALGYHGPLIVAPNGVAAPESAAWDGGSTGCLLYVGRFDPEHKGLDLLVHAVARLPRMALPPLEMYGPDWRGGKPRLQRLVEQLGVGDRVRVHDSVLGEAKWELMSRAVGFVYPSRWEGFGNAPAEAAALGVPTLVTPYPLGAYLHQQGAAVLAPATVSGLMEGLRRLVGDEAAAIGARARRVVRTSFTWEAVARSWMEQLPVSR